MFHQTCNMLSGGYIIQVFILFYFYEIINSNKRYKINIYHIINLSYIYIYICVCVYYFYILNNITFLFINLKYFNYKYC